MSVHLVIGASGLVGSHLLARLKSNGAVALGTYHHHPQPGLLPLDIQDAKAVRRLLNETAPDVVYFPAALTNVDYCEKNPEQSYRVNVLGTSYVTLAAERLKSTLVFFSSDYVFDGNKGPYREADPVHPLCIYGFHKVFAENFVSLNSSRYLIIRTTWVYGWETQGKNFVQRLITMLRNTKTVEAPIDQFGNPTYAPNLADFVIELVNRGRTGLFHVVGPSRMNRYEFAKLAARVFDLDQQLILPVQTQDLHQAAPRPLNAGLINKKAQRVVHTKLLGSLDGLRLMAAHIPS